MYPSASASDPASEPDRSSSSGILPKDLFWRHFIEAPSIIRPRPSSGIGPPMDPWPWSSAAVGSTVPSVTVDPNWLMAAAASSTMNVDGGG